MSTPPLTYEIHHYLQADSVRIELNCRVPDWCPRIVAGEEIPSLELGAEPSLHPIVGDSSCQCCLGSGTFKKPCLGDDSMNYQNNNLVVFGLCFLICFLFFINYHLCE